MGKAHLNNGSNDTPKGLKFDEIEVLHNKAQAEGMSAEQKEQLFKDAIIEKLVSLMQIVRMSAHQHPEIKQILHAITDTTVNVRDVATKVNDYPVAIELMSAIENGFAGSSHSSLEEPVLTRLVEAAHRAYIEQCAEQES